MCHANASAKKCHKPVFTFRLGEARSLATMQTTRTMANTTRTQQNIHMYRRTQTYNIHVCTMHGARQSGFHIARCATGKLIRESRVKPDCNGSDMFRMRYCTHRSAPAKFLYIEMPRFSVPPAHRYFSKTLNAANLT